MFYELSEPYSLHGCERLLVMLYSNRCSPYFMTNLRHQSNIASRPSLDSNLDSVSTMA